MRIRVEVRELLVGWTLQTIGDLFEAEAFTADLQHEPAVGGQRRSYGEQFYAGIDWTALGAVERYLRVVERVRDESRSPEVPKSLDRLLARDGFTITAEGAIRTKSMALTAQTARALPAESAIPGHLERMWANVQERPEQAISAAKDAIEATAKHALGVLGATLTGKERFPDLVQRVQKELKLHPATVGPTQKGAEAIVRVLGGPANIALGVDELRNLYGDGHGRATRLAQLTPRHSRLAGRCADAYVQMVLETLEASDVPWRRLRPPTQEARVGSPSSVR